jgi:FlgD Ig-like domain
MRQTTTYLLLFLLIGTITISADADIRNEGVKVRIDGEPRAAVAGESFDAILNFHGLADHLVEDITITGDGWSVVISDPIADFVISKDEIVQLAFTATPSDPTQPLSVSWQRDGKLQSKSFDLSREYFEQVRMPMSLTFARGEAIDINGKETPPWERLVSYSASGTENRDEAENKSRVDPILVEGTIAAYHTPSSQSYIPRDCLVWVFCNGIPFPFYGNTDEYGDFSIEITPLESDPEPTIQVAFLATNSHITVHDDDWDSDAWITWCPVQENISGPVHDYGSVISTSENFHKALYIAETTLRCWEYYNYERGFNTSHIRAHYPSDESDTYWSGNKMWIGRSHGWHEGVILHEYGHHWNDDFAAMPDFDYCNDECDDPDCGHCVWCTESHEVAWNEGIANFFSELATDYIKDTFSYPHPDSVLVMGIESISDGAGCFNPPTPYLTEGFFAAQLLDLADVDTDCDTQTPGYCDVAVGWVDEVFEVITNSCPGEGHYPRSPQEFSICFKARYPELGADFWETSRNCDIWTDDYDPGMVTIGNHYPDTWTPTTDNRITVYWITANDDLSGIAGYSISWTPGMPALPNQTMDIGAINGVQSDPLEPDDYWFCIRAIDRAGNWSPDYVYVGPFQIIEGFGADLKYDWRSGWDYTVVPTKNTNSSEGNVHVSGNLDGGEPTTYWNVAGKNIGNGTSTVSAVAVLVDDEEIDSYVWPPMPPGSEYRECNRGPVTVPPGRHIFGMQMDSDEVNGEPIEVNNYRSGQWAWRPTSVLPVNTLTQYAAPALPMAGFEYFGWEQPAFYNCDGYRLPSYNLYQAVYMYPYPQYGQENYDLRLFGPQGLPEMAYFETIGESLRPGGYLEAVLVYGLNQGLDACHLGVYNWENGGGSVGYRMNRVQDEYIGTTYGTYHATLYDEQMMKIYSFVVDEPVTLKLINHSSESPLYLGYFDGEFAAGGLLDAAQIEAATADSAAVIRVYPGGTDLCAAVLWRELDGQLWSANNVTFIIEPMKPDLVAEAPGGWDAALTPYPNHDPAYPWYTLPAPDVLYGDDNSTYLYFGGKNQSDVACPEFELQANLDGELLTWFNRSGVSPWSEFKFTGANPYWVYGGRHILSMELDRGEDVDEEFEGNNIYGRQWVWSPSLVYPDNPDVINYIPSAFGGYDQVTDGFAHYNCVGWRTQDLSPSYARFVSFYSLCDAATDVDVRIYDPHDGAEHGFAGYFAASSFGNGEADFVLVDLLEMDETSFEFGLLRLDGTGDGLMEFDVSGSVVHYDPGSFSDSLQTNEYTELFLLSLGYGEREVRLIPDPGTTVDLGISIVQTGAQYKNRMALSEHFSSWDGLPDEDEVIQVTAPPQGGTYGLLVWRTDADQAGIPCGYTISLTDGSSDVEVDFGDPTVTRLLPAMPNPFDGQTTLSFELATPEKVRLRILDVCGAVMFDHQPGLMPPGRHNYVWDGRGKQGHRIPSGIYYVHLEAGKTVGTKKVIYVE